MNVWRYVNPSSKSTTYVSGYKRNNLNKDDAWNEFKKEYKLKYHDEINDEILQVCFMDMGWKGIFKHRWIELHQEDVNAILSDYRLNYKYYEEIVKEENKALEEASKENNDEEELINMNTSISD